MAFVQTEAVVLRVRPLGEADRLLHLYAGSEGKLQAVARGARRPRNRLLGATQLFSHTRFLLLSGRSLHTVSQAELIESFQPLREDLHKLAYASYAAELLDRSVEEGAGQEGLYRLLLDTLRLIARGAGLPAVTRAFELGLLSAVGVGPRLEGCVACGCPRAAGWRFSPAEGGLLCQSCAGRDPHARSIGAGELEALRFLARGVEPAPRLALGREAEERIKELLREYLDHHLPGAPRSRAFLDGIEAGENGKEKEGRWA